MKIRFIPNRTGYIVLFIVLTILALILLTNRKKIKKKAMEVFSYLKQKTWDILSDRKIETLHPKIRAMAKAFIIRAEKELGIKLRVVSALRTWDEQSDLYNQPNDGKDNDGDGQVDEADEKVSNAKAGDSLHNYGLALDVVEVKNGQALWNNPNWEKIAALGKSIGFEWGGDWKSFKDKPHFQYSFGKTLAELRQMYRSGNRTGEYINFA